MTDCKYFEACDAPMCPKQEPVKTVWFPGESVCKLQDAPGWVKRQRKVARKVTAGGFWTKRMFEQDCRLSAGPKGWDADSLSAEHKRLEGEWLEKHPAITAEEREKLRAQGIANNRFLAEG
jgi:hypothetical protein